MSSFNAHRTKRSGQVKQFRAGAVMVEFAIVFPVVMTVAYGLFELARAQTIASTARTSVMVGAREASVASSNVEQVIAEMEDILDVFGVDESEITLSPKDFSDADEVTVQISVPFSSSNGLVLYQYVGGKTVNFSATVSR